MPSNRSAEPPFLHPRKRKPLRVSPSNPAFALSPYARFVVLDLQETAIVTVMQTAVSAAPRKSQAKALGCIAGLCAHQQLLKPAESRRRRVVPNHGDGGPGVVLHFRAHRAAANQDAKPLAKRQACRAFIGVLKRADGPASLARGFPVPPNPEISRRMNQKLVTPTPPQPLKTPDSTP